MRPGYYPFCLNDEVLHASQRLESWTRDHKLWVHVNENHLRGRQWPATCPHPLCDASFENDAMLQFHFVDDHGFSRTRPGSIGRRRLLQQRQQHSSPNSPLVGREPDRKRKSLDEKGLLQWMPPMCFPAVAVPTESPSPVRPFKRARAVDLTLCASPPPEIADPIGDQPHVVRSQAPIGSLTRFAMDGCLGHAGVSVAPHKQSGAEWRLDAAGSSDIMTTDASSTGDSLFPQYLRSPSSSCSPADAFDS